jgi:hypothetical protein
MGRAANDPRRDAAVVADRCCRRPRGADREQRRVLEPVDRRHLCPRGGREEIRGGLAAILVVPLVPRDEPRNLVQCGGARRPEGQIQPGLCRSGQPAGYLAALWRWGWPTTIIFGPDGTEIAKLRGFHSPQYFSPVLTATVGAKDDPRSAALYKAALAYPLGNKRTEWWDKREGRLANIDGDYPDYPDGPAAFACTSTFCSYPVTEPGEIEAQLDGLKRARKM